MTSTTIAPQGCTNLKLRQLVRGVTRLYDAEMAPTGLKTTQYSLLSGVLTLAPVRPGDLARALRLEPSTLTRNLRPLVAAGWIELGAGTDARSRMVTLTEAGRAKRQAARRSWKVAQERLNRRLGIERVAALHALLDEAMTLLGESGTMETEQAE